MIAVALYAHFIRQYKSASAASKAVALQASGGKKTDSKERVGLNGKFIQQMRKLLPILVPRLVCRESALLLGLGGVLIARTWLDSTFLCGFL